MPMLALAPAVLLVPLLASPAFDGGFPQNTTLSVSDVRVTEGDSGMTKFTADVQIVGYEYPVDVQVEVSATAGTADETDFSVTPSTVTLGNGKVAQVSGVVLGDRSFEGEEIFYIQARAPIGGPFFHKDGVITIVDDDADLAPHVSADPVEVPEGSTGWHQIAVPMRLDRPLEVILKIDVRPVGGSPVTTAAAWGNYRTPKEGAAYFSVGQTEATFLLEVNGDTIWEPDTGLTLELSEHRGAILDTPSVPVTLVNDDAPNVVTIDDVRTNEGQTGAQFVSLRAAFAGGAPPFSSVRVNVVGGTARAGEDFMGQTVDLQPSPGSAAVTFAVKILSDRTPECDEGIVIEYEAVGTGDATKKEAKLLIVDDDGAPADPSTCPDPFATRSVPFEPRPDAGGADARGPTAAGSSGCGCVVQAPRSGRDGSIWPLGLLAAAAALCRVRRRWPAP